MNTTGRNTPSPYSNTVRHILRQTNEAWHQAYDTNNTPEARNTALARYLELIIRLGNYIRREASDRLEQ